MYAPLSATLSPERVLLYSGSESSVRTDVRALRSLGVSAFSHVSGPAEAVSFLEKALERASLEQNGKKTPPNAVDLVVCNEEANGVPAFELLQIMAGHPVLCRQPVLVFASSPKASRDLRALGVYVLERPYAEQDLQRMARKAMSPMRRILRPEVFAAAADKKAAVRNTGKKRSATKSAAPMTTSDWFAKGMAHLRNNETSDARLAFARVLARDEDHPGAALGLARLCRTCGDAKGTRRYLLKASAACLRKGDKMQAAAITAMLPVGMRDKVFVHEAIDLMENGSYRQAALSFLDAGKETPNTPLHRIIARACLMTARPEEGMAKLCDALEGLGHILTASALRRRLLHYQPFVVSERPTWLDNYPRLKEAVQVASYTAWAWKQA